MRDSLPASDVPYPAGLAQFRQGRSLSALYTPFGGVVTCVISVPALRVYAHRNGVRVEGRRERFLHNKQTTSHSHPLLSKMPR
jgi:hypothetical protein